MVTIDATARTHDGITLVTATLEGGPVPTRVTLHNRLDGPVWPPRRTGVPVTGWTDEGYEGVVPAGGRLALGYASPTAPADEPADPPLEVVATERASRAEEGEFGSPSAVLRGLGSPAPPRDAVPLPVPEENLDVADTGTDPPATDPDPSADSATAAIPQECDSEPRPTGDSEVPSERESPAPPEREVSPAPPDREAPPMPSDSESPTPSDADLPEPVLAWLERTARRVERAETLAEATDVPAATEAVRDVGSLEAVADLERRRSTDAEGLREIATRANALAYRAESAEVPLETLERLA